MSIASTGRRSYHARRSGAMTDEDLIHQTKTEFREGFNNGDPARVLRCFGSNGFANLSDGMPSFWGDDARRMMLLQLEETFARFDVELGVIIVRTTVLGDTAISSGWHRFMLHPKSGGDPLRRRERYFEIWRKDPADGWRIHYYMTNRELSPRMVEELTGNAALRPDPAN